MVLRFPNTFKRYSSNYKLGWPFWEVKNQFTCMVAEMLQKEFLCDIKIYFYSIKINFYSIKYIYDIKIYFYSIKTNLYSKKQTFLLYNFFHPIKIFLYYLSFPFDTFLVTISGLPFLFAKVRILLSVCKLKSSTMLQESC